jgi:formylglycine-generating enzyme required for sulfatase activity
MRAALYWMIAVCGSLLSAACAEDELPPCPSDDMQEINAPALNLSFKIDRYEAARSNASASSEGSGESRACSMVGVKPWHTVTFGEAKAACEASGKHLCTKAEWQAVCQNTAQKTFYVYGNTYEEGRCNDSNASTSSNPAGAAANCKTLLNTFDMNGNVREWVAEGELLGGAFVSGRLEARCDNAIAPSGGADAYQPGIGDGFRCCQ